MDSGHLHIAGNRFTGDLHTYRITATLEEIDVDVTLVGDVGPWRPGTGYMLYGAERDHEIAWLTSVPQGKVTAHDSIDGAVHTAGDIGYHAHN